MHLNYRRLAHVQHRIIGEIRLLDPAILDCNLAEHRRRQAVNNTAFHLSTDRIRVDRLPAVGQPGYISDYGMERLYRDMRLFRIYEGTSQIQQLIIAKDVIKEIVG